MPLVLNIMTGRIYPKYHVVFDNELITVQSLSEEADPTPWWNVVDLEENTVYIPVDDDVTPLLDKNLISPEELEERSCRKIRQTQLRQALTPATTQIPSTAPTIALPTLYTPSLPNIIRSSNTVVNFKETLDLPTVTLKQVIP